MKSTKHSFILLYIIGYFVAVSLFSLHDLPGEWYGDISNEHEYVREILDGKWPIYFLQSTGPVYHYLVAPFARLFGSTWETYKYVSIFIAVSGIIMVYLLARELFNPDCAVLSALSAALSFWLISWARLGSSPQMLSPFMSAATVYFAVRFRRTRSLYDGVCGGIISSLGLLTYPGLYVLPMVYYILLFMIFHEIGYPGMKRVVVFLSALPVSIGFVLIVFSQSDNFTSGYVGSKVFSDNRNISELAGTFGSNILKGFGGLFFQGDRTFRFNIPGRPHLDPATQIFMGIGLLFLIIRKRLFPLWIILVPLCIFLIPSVLPTILPGEIPSMGRTLAQAPFCFILAGLGINIVLNGIARFSQSGASVAFLITISILALQSLIPYFLQYPRVLPENNSPWGRLIAEYIDRLPSGVPVFMTSCCWGKAGIPEPKAIEYRVHNPAGKQILFKNAFVTSCDDMRPYERFVLIFDPKATQLQDSFYDCYPDGHVRMHVDKYGLPFVTYLEVGVNQQ